jgi:hypothetical protein
MCIHCDRSYIAHRVKMEFCLEDFFQGEADMVPRFPEDDEPKSTTAHGMCTRKCNEGLCGNTLPYVNFIAGETHNIDRLQFTNRAQRCNYACPCTLTNKDSLNDCKCARYGVVYPELPRSFGIVFGDDLPLPSEEAFRLEIEAGIYVASKEYTHVTGFTPTHPVREAIRAAVNGYVREGAPEFIQCVTTFDMEYLMKHIIRHLFKFIGHFKIEGEQLRLILHNGNLNLKEYDEKGTIIRNVYNNDALDMLFGMFYGRSINDPYNRAHRPTTLDILRQVWLHIAMHELD